VGTRFVFTLPAAAAADDQHADDAQPRALEGTAS
jgi:hypothetical protein